MHFENYRISAPQRVTGRCRPVRPTEEELRLEEVTPLLQGHETEKRCRGVLVRVSCWCPGLDHGQAWTIVRALELQCRMVPL